MSDELDVLIVNGHPRAGAYCDALEEAYAQGARSEGLSVEVLRVRDLVFDPNLRAPLSGGHMGLETDLIRAQTRIRAARHLVWVYPNWWGGQPALLKGFIDRVMLPGFAFKYRPKGSLVDPLLAGRSARLVVSMDGPDWWYVWMMGAGGDRAMRRSILNFCGVKTWGVTYADELRGRHPSPAGPHLDRVEAAARKDGRRLSAERRRKTSQSGPQPGLQRAQMSKSA